MKWGNEVRENKDQGGAVEGRPVCEDTKLNKTGRKKTKGMDYQLKPESTKVQGRLDR